MLCRAVCPPNLLELGKLVNVRLEKLKLFKSQNVQDEIINRSVYGGKIASIFITGAPDVLCVNNMEKMG